MSMNVPPAPSKPSPARHADDSNVANIAHSESTREPQGESAAASGGDGGNGDHGEPKGNDGNGAKVGGDVWPLVELYSDGACSGNPGKGGWAYILRHLSTGTEKESSGAERDTTNNRMELLAVIRGLEALRRPCRVHLFTDSKYVGQGLTEWLPNWKARGWKRGKDPVKNVELWQQLDALASRHKLRFTHVRGHSGHPENERCDQLAVAAYQNLR
jgi:ribonuclease HI